jgi:nucleotide-binding universal stress UspA family protein
MENEQNQEPALDHARRLAQRTGATVILAWLVPVAASEERFFTQIQVEPGSSGARRKQAGEEFLAQAEETFRTDGVHTVPRIVVTAVPPEQAIIDLIAEEGIDLVIMATLSQSAVGRFLFGSVGDKVRRRSPVPVLFVSEHQQPGNSPDAADARG